MGFGLEEVRLIAQRGGRLEHQIAEPRRGVGVALDVEVGVADHVEQEEGFDLGGGAVLVPLLREVLGAVKAVGGGPFDEGLFPVGPQQPHAVAVVRLAAELVRQFEHQAGVGAAVVRADKVLWAADSSSRSVRRRR